MTDDGVSASEAPSFADCYRTYHARVFHHALRYGGGDAAWAEDLAHDVFVKLARKLPELERVDDLGGWLYRVTSNLAVSRLRRDRSLWGRVRLALSSEEPEHAPGVDVLFEEREASARALATLGRLPARERVVAVMRFLDGKNQKEIAATLSLSEGYVSKLVKRALKRIRAEQWEVGDV